MFATKTATPQWCGELHLSPVENEPKRMTSQTEAPFITQTITVPRMVTMPDTKGEKGLSSAAVFGSSS